MRRFDDAQPVLWTDGRPDLFYSILCSFCWACRSAFALALDERELLIVVVPHGLFADVMLVLRSYPRLCKGQVGWYSQ